MYIKPKSLKLLQFSTSTQYLNKIYLNKIYLNKIIFVYLFRACHIIIIFFKQIYLTFIYPIRCLKRVGKQKLFPYVA